MRDFRNSSKCHQNQSLPWPGQHLSPFPSSITPQLPLTPFRWQLRLLPGFHTSEFYPVPQLLFQSVQLTQWWIPTLPDCPSCTRARSHLIRMHGWETNTTHQKLLVREMERKTLGKRGWNWRAQRGVEKPRSSSVPPYVSSSFSIFLLPGSLSLSQPTLPNLLAFLVCLAWPASPF